MTDQKPPRSAAGERETVMALLQYQRESLIRKVSGVDDRLAVESPVPTGTSLVWLVRHMAEAEATWVLDRFAGIEARLPDAGTGVGEAVARYRAVWARVDEVVAGAGLDDLCRRPGGDEEVSLRWVLVHLLEETARHAGHADILRELIDGETGR